MPIEVAPGMSLKILVATMAVVTTLAGHASADLARPGVLDAGTAIDAAVDGGDGDAGPDVVAPSGPVATSDDEPTPCCGFQVAPTGTHSTTVLFGALGVGAILASRRRRG